MPYRFMDDAPTADVGFVASAETLDGCFRAAADATLQVMLANPESLEIRERRRVQVESDSVDLALLKFLEEVVYFKDAERLFLRVEEIRVTPQPAGWRVNAVLAGEPIHPSRHQLSGDVKAVTLHRLHVKRVDGGWEATVVLDV